MVAESGHVPNRTYIDQSGAEHLDGAPLFTADETDVSGSLESAVKFSATFNAKNTGLVSLGTTAANGKLFAPHLYVILIAAASDDATASAAVHVGTIGPDYDDIYHSNGTGTLVIAGNYDRPFLANSLFAIPPGTPLVANVVAPAVGTSMTMSCTLFGAYL